MTVATFDLEEYRRERLRSLERRCDFLDGERRRLEWLLGFALEIAVGKTGVTPLTLLEVLCTAMPTNPASGHDLERRDRLTAELRLDRVVDVLQETAA